MNTLLDTELLPTEIRAVKNMVFGPRTGRLVTANFDDIWHIQAYIQAPNQIWHQLARIQLDPRGLSRVIGHSPTATG